MTFENDIETLVNTRHSVRTYDKQLLELSIVEKIVNSFQFLPNSPFKTKVRLQLIAATVDDGKVLKDLGTYGFIKNPAAFIAGACEDSDAGLIDFGYLMEYIILYLTDLRVGTCWLGGSFRKGRFSKTVNLHEKEILPCVISIGYPVDRSRWMDRFLRFMAGSNHRKPWETLFYENDFDNPLSFDNNECIHFVLDLVRKSPSASNRQPWRVVLQPGNNQVHFYLQRIGHYKKNLDLLKLPDLQKVDMGIAACHFDLAMQSVGQSGKWIVHNPEIDIPNETEYLMSCIM